MRVCFWSRDGKGHTLGFVVDTSVLGNGTMSRSNSICNRENSWCLDHVHFYSFFLHGVHLICLTVSVLL